MLIGVIANAPCNRETLTHYNCSEIHQQGPKAYFDFTKVRIDAMLQLPSTVSIDKRSENN